MTCLHIATKPTKANPDPNGVIKYFSALNHGELQSRNVERCCSKKLLSQLDQREHSLQSTA
jgi:hypothetical protein